MVVIVTVPPLMTATVLGVAVAQEELKERTFLSPVTIAPPVSLAVLAYVPILTVFPILKAPGFRVTVNAIIYSYTVDGSPSRAYVVVAPAAVTKQSATDAVPRVVDSSVTVATLFAHLTKLPAVPVEEVA